MNAAEKVDFLDGRLTSEQVRLRGFVNNRELAIRDHEVFLSRLALAIEGQQDAVEDLAHKLQLAEAELAEEVRLEGVAAVQRELDELLHVEALEAARQARVTELRNQLGSPATEGDAA